MDILLRPGQAVDADEKYSILHPTPAGMTGLTFVFDADTSVLATGIMGSVTIPFRCTLKEVYLLAVQTGSIQIDIWKSTYETYMPSAINSICGESKPKITSSNKSNDKKLTGWNKELHIGDMLTLNIDSCSGIKKVTMTIYAGKK
jgi:hypothetical protein